MHYFCVYRCRDTMLTTSLICSEKARMTNEQYFKDPSAWESGPRHSTRAKQWDFHYILIDSQKRRSYLIFYLHAPAAAAAVASHIILAFSRSACGRFTAKNSSLSLCLSQIASGLTCGHPRVRGY